MWVQIPPEALNKARVDVARVDVRRIVVNLKLSPALSTLTIASRSQRCEGARHRCSAQFFGTGHPGTAGSNGVIKLSQPRCG